MLGTMKAELILRYVQGQVIFISYEIVINFIRQAKPNLESKMPAIVLTTSDFVSFIAIELLKLN